MKKHCYILGAGVHDQRAIMNIRHGFSLLLMKILNLELATKTWLN